MTVPQFEKPEQNAMPESPRFPARNRKGERAEGPMALGREVHEKYPVAVVGEVEAPANAGTAAEAAADHVANTEGGQAALSAVVSSVKAPRRVFSAEGFVLMDPKTQAMVLESRASAEDALAYARVTGIMGAKRASDLIPQCPQSAVKQTGIDILPLPASGPSARKDGRTGFHVLATCITSGTESDGTEALTAVSVACLAIYDLCKDAGNDLEVAGIRLIGTAENHSGHNERMATSALQAATHGANVLGKQTEPDAIDDSPSPLPGGPNAGRPAPAIAFVGYQNSGKTTLVEKVIARLTQRGLRVGTIKLHGTKGFEIDQPGKDSWRHAQAGSSHVGLVAAGQYAEYARVEGEVPIADLLTRYTDVDVVIVEGYRAADLPNIVVARSGIDRMRDRDSFGLIDGQTLAVTCNGVVERDFRARALAKERTAAEAEGRPFYEEDVVLPQFLDINDSAAIASFVYDHLQRL